MMSSRKGQIWSVDFILSFVMFLIAVLIAYTLINNMFIDESYEEVRRQAQDAAALLVEEGFPAHYNETDVLRAGLRADDRLSLRKATVLAALSSDDLRSALRSTDSIYVFITNRTNHTYGIFESCGIGDIQVNGIERNMTLRTMAFAGPDATFSDGLGITVYRNDSAYNAMERSDIIIIDGNITATSAQTSDEISTWIDQVASKGKNILVIGDPGTSILGLEVNSTLADEWAAVDDAMQRFNISTSQAVNLSGGPLTIATLQQVSGTHVSKYRELAFAAGKVAAASWLYKDTQVWYLSTIEGEKADGRAWSLDLGGMVNDTITVNRPICDPVSFPSGSDQIATQQRTLAYHDELMTINVVVWRDR